MGIIYKILSRLSLALLFILSLWMIGFYHAIMDEINDEIDDNLELMAETVIRRTLAGKEVPDHFLGSNNSYYIRTITTEEAMHIPHWQFEDKMVYIKEKKETEPARIFHMVFKDKDQQHYQVTVLTPHIEKKDLMESIAFWIVALGLLLLVSVILLSASIIIPSMQPLGKLSTWLENYRIDKQTPLPKNQSTVKEFETLYHALYEFVERNEQIYQHQNEFVGNASHEMQTPLAIALNRLEILSQSDLSEEQLTQVTKVQKRLRHLNRLNKTLLLLFKIENNQFKEREEVDVNKVVGEMIEDFEDIFPGKEVVIQEKSPLTLLINKQLFDILITNLIKNAFLYTVSGGQISIEISSNRIAVVNDAIQKTPLNDKKLFDRFYRMGKSDGTGSGLGLSLVKAIADRYQIAINYQFISNKHHFILKWDKNNPMISKRFQIRS